MAAKDGLLTQLNHAEEELKVAINLIEKQTEQEIRKSGSWRDSQEEGLGSPMSPTSPMSPKSPQRLEQTFGISEERLDEIQDELTKLDVISTTITKVDDTDNVTAEWMKHEKNLRAFQDGLTSNELKVAKLRKWPLIDYSHETSGLELTVNALWRKKERLETDLEWYKEKEANVMACIDRYGFIYASYQPHAWYWEVVELVRKFMLVSLVIFVEPGTATQLAFAFMIAFAFLVAHVYSKAYPEPSDDTYQLVSMISVVLTLYMGILLKLDMSGETGYGKALMGFLLTAIQLGIVFIFVFFLANGKGKDDDEAPSTKVYKMLERKMGGCAYQSAMNKLGEELQEKKKDLEEKLETLVESGNLRPVWKKLAVALVDDTVKDLASQNAEGAGHTKLELFVKDMTKLAEVDLANPAEAAKQVSQTLLQASRHFASPEVVRIVVEALIEWIQSECRKMHVPAYITSSLSVIPPLIGTLIEKRDLLMDRAEEMLNVLQNPSKSVSGSFSCMGKKRQRVKSQRRILLNRSN